MEQKLSEIVKLVEPHLSFEDFLKLICLTHSVAELHNAEIQKTKAYEKLIEDFISEYEQITGKEL